MINRLVRLFIQDCDNVTDPAVREKYGVLSGAVGIVLNLLLSAGKFFAGVVTGSIAITADAFNNLSDAGSSVVTLVGFKLAGQKADDGHPFGHGRAEYLAGLLVSLMILLVGLELGKTSIGKILHPEAVDFSLVSVAILAASILVKLWMSHFNRVLGKKLGSAAMAGCGAYSKIEGFGGHRRGLPLRRGGDLRRVGGHPGRTLRPPEHRRLGGGGGGRLYSEGGLGSRQGHH